MVEDELVTLRLILTANCRAPMHYNLVEATFLNFVRIIIMGEYYKWKRHYGVI